MSNSKVLIIDDDTSVLHTFCKYLDMHGYAACGAKDYDSALDMLSKEQVDVVFSDIFLKERTGIDILKEIKSRGLQSPVIMITGEPDIETASASVRLGAFDYITKPVREDAFIEVTKRAIQYKTFLEEKAVIEREKERYRSHMEAVFQSVEDAIVTVDNGMQVTQVNAAFENICRANSIIGKTPSQIRNKCSLQCWSVFEDALKTRNFIREYRIECEHAGNPQQVVLLNVTPLRDGEGNQIGGVMVIRDISRLSLLEEVLQDRNKAYDIIGRDKKMQDIYTLLDNLRDMETTVLITGPSGTGKELVARAVHYSGIRSNKPFVVVNCSALSENLLESELFGHVKGAFTGAVKDKVGRFQLANHGTLFLDEIGDISSRVQLKLLRVLEAREFERVGDPTPIKMDVRIISATNQDLREKVKRGEFREDLYYRLKVVEIKVPQLKDRRDDIPLLVDHYLSVFNNRFNRRISGLSKEADKIFMEYDWPGNIRELIHVLEHAFVVCKGHVIEATDLPPEIKENPCDRFPHVHQRRAAHITREDILDALGNTGWNKVQTARVLGICRAHLYKKMKDYDIHSAAE